MSIHTPLHPLLPQPAPLVRALRAALLGSLALAATLPAQAQENAQATQAQYRLAAGPLEDALNTFARDHGVALSFDPILTAGKTAPALEGNPGVAAGFRALLTGSGLELVPQGEGYTLAQAPTPVAATATPDSVTATTLPTVVVSASGFEQEIKDAPASITVITPEDLRGKRINSIADALADVEGIDISSSAGKTGGLTVRMRGLDDEYVLVLVDGRRQNSTGNITPNGFTESNNVFIPPVSAIERIEVIRGPMATLYGSDAMGGVVNIITRKVGSTWHGSIKADTTLQKYSSDFGDSRSTEIYAAGPLLADLLGLQVRGRKYEREQSTVSYVRDDSTEVDLSMGNNPTKADVESFGLKLTLTPHKDHDLAFDFDRAEQWYDNSKGQLGTLGAAGGYGPSQEYHREKLTLTHAWRNSLGLLESSAARNQTRTYGRIVPARLVSRGGQERRLESEDTIVDTKLVTGIGNSMLTVGAQYWEASITDALRATPAEFRQISVFLENEWRIIDSLALTLGARHDDHDTFGGFTTPRAYLVWNANDHFTFKGGISKGYKVPRLEQLTPGIYSVGGQGRSPQVGNPDLEPETSTNTEVGFIFDNLDGYSAGVTLFRNQIKDKIGSGPRILLPNSVGNTSCTANNAANKAECELFLGGEWVMQPGDTINLSRNINIDEVQTQGIEVFNRYRMGNWSAGWNYTYSDSEIKSGANAGATFNDSPDHMANANVRWQYTPKLSYWLRGEYRGERYRSDGAAKDAFGDFKAYSLFHAGASYQASENFTLDAAVYNLADKNFVDYVRIPGSTPASYTNLYNNSQEERRLWLSATYSF